MDQNEKRNKDSSLNRGLILLGKKESCLQGIEVMSTISYQVSRGSFFFKKK